MRKYGSGWRLLLLLSFFLAGALSPAASQDNAASPLPLPNTSYLNSDGTMNWQALDLALQNASAIADQAAVSADNVQSSLEGLQRQYTILLKASQDADKAARTAVASARLGNDLWRSGALIVAGALVGCLIDPKDTGWGALGGAVAAGTWELVVQIKIKIPVIITK